MFNRNHGGENMLLLGSTSTHRNFHITGLPPSCEHGDSIGQTKEYNGVCLRDQPRVRQHYEHRWYWFDFDDSPHSNQRIDKTIGPTTDHKDQSMKISSFFSTPYTRISLWNELGQASFYLPTQILGEGWFTRNQLDHELNIAVRWQPGNTSEKIFGKSRSTDMLLGSRTILLFEARRDDQ